MEWRDALGSGCSSTRPHVATKITHDLGGIIMSSAGVRYVMLLLLQHLLWLLKLLYCRTCMLAAGVISMRMASRMPLLAQ